MFQASRIGGIGASELHPITLAITVVAVIAVMVVPRRYVMVPLLPPMLLIPMWEGVAIGGLHFPVSRVMLFSGGLRLLGLRMAGEEPGRRSPLDAVLLASVLVSATAFCLLWRDGAAVINRGGFLYNVVGMYVLFRFFIRDWDGADRAFATVAAVCAIIAVGMTVEQATGRNPFSLLGASEISAMREGRLRSQGPFAHPLLAGTFGATMLLPFVGLWIRGHRVSGAIGIASTTVMTLASASSTPIVAYVAGLGALSLWPLRAYLRAIRWGMAATVVALHLSMKAPVWALVGRFDAVGGSSSSHRYELIDQFIRRAGEWWLIGTKSTAHWGWFLGDTSNTYVETGVTGGLASLVLFVALIAVAFSRLGRTRKTPGTDSLTQRSLWVFGAALVSHLVAFVGVTYFDNTGASWYLLLAAIAVTTSLGPAAVVAPAHALERGMGAAEASIPGRLQPFGSRAVWRSAERPHA